ncbi:Rad17 cell cycle checkpoint protein-domain-containing protein [Mariannaea sp. PMI_226]|nr:Rad17 cell cycle checkpoint protein-domain-containing protein [Mariannaea sp. PMI_226]
MAPPAKRRRRNVVDTSDDEDNQVRTNTLTNFLLSSPNSPSKIRAPTASPSPSKSRSISGSLSTNGSSRLTRRTLPQKNDTGTSPRKSKDVRKGQDDGKTADLKTLFSKQAQRATKAGGITDRKTIPLDDIISDPISEDDEISELKVSSSSLVGQHAMKRLRNGTQAIQVEAPSASQRFLKPARPAFLTPVLNDETRPWSERFGPRNLDELAVHKRKVADVRKWLEAVTTGRMRQRVLILKGAAGSGKTTTARLLASDMGYELLEWRNPTDTLGLGVASASAQFGEFLGRGGKFGALDTDSPESTAPVNSNSASKQHQSKRIILIEEFPNTFSRSSSALSSFRNTIIHYLAANTPPLSMFTPSQKDPITPVILVISETLLTTTSASADSFTAHRLLGPEVLRHPGVGVIEFNPIAPTLLSKALELVVQKEARKSGRKKTPGPQVLKRLGEVGDIRSAVASLEFLCLKGDHGADWGAKVAFTKQRKGVKDAISLTKGEQDSLELISQREASLGIFHAVGKVVYNKRDEAPPPNDTVEKLPHHLSQHSRPKRSEVSVDSLIDEIGTDTHTFISALHENYLPSCESTEPMDLNTSIDYVNECIEYLSQSDLLCPSRDVFFGGRGGFVGAGSGSQLLRQDEMTFQVAVRGMLFALPNPVKRKTTGMTKSSDAFKMFYPTSIKLWRAKEEMEGLVDSWSTKLLRGEASALTKNLTDGAASFRRPQQSAGDGSSWMQRQQHKSAAVSGKRQEDDPQDSSSGDAPLLSLGSAARREMLLERLPYMAQIARARQTSTAFRLRDLEKVVSFRGINTADEESDVEDDANSGEAWATDKPSEEASPRKKSTRIRAGGMSTLLSQKLVLSDDDIED